VNNFIGRGWAIGFFTIRPISRIRSRRVRRIVLNNFVFNTRDTFSDQLKEIKKSSIARLICDNCAGIDKIQNRAFEMPDNDNLYRQCSDFVNIPVVNLKHWKEY
jgi:hypothetical protein